MSSHTVTGSIPVERGARLRREAEAERVRPVFASGKSVLGLAALVGL